MKNVSQLLGSRIKRARKDRGFTIDSFAKALGKSKSTVSKYENGIICVDAETLYAIATILDVDMKDLADIHLRSSPSPKMAKNHYFNVPRIYMYYFDGRYQRIIKSLIMLHYSKESGIYEALMYNDCKNFKDYEKCEDIYTGQFEGYDVISYGTLKNRMNNTLHMYLCILNPGHPKTPAQGMMTAIGSSTFFAPLAVKAIFSATPLTEDADLKAALLLARSELKDTKDLNMLVANRFTTLKSE